MSILSKIIAGASLICVALSFLYAGSAGTPAFAQYDVPPGNQYGPAPGQYGQYEQYDVPLGDQYGLPPEDQYGVPPEDQYDVPPTTTAPLPENQYGTPAEERNVEAGGTGNGDTAPVDEGGEKGGDAGGNTGGGNTGRGNGSDEGGGMGNSDPTSVDDGNDAGGDTGTTAPVGEGPDEDDDATESATTPERQGSCGRGIGPLGGVLVGGVVLLAVLALIAALAVFIERRGDREGW